MLDSLKSSTHSSFTLSDCLKKIISKEKKIETEKDEYKLTKYQIDLDEARYGLANAQLVAKDRMREIKLWSTLKKEFDDDNLNKNFIKVDSPKIAFAKVLENLKRKNDHSHTVSESAFIHKSAKIGMNVHIEPNVVIEKTNRKDSLLIIIEVKIIRMYNIPLINLGKKLIIT